MNSKIEGPKWGNALFAQNIQRFVPFSKLIRKMFIFCKTRFVENREWGDQTLKKKNIYIYIYIYLHETRVHGTSVP